MLKLSAKVRKKETKNLRDKDFLPAVLYGPKIENIDLTINKKEFEKIFNEAGESSLIDLEIEEDKNKYLVLIHDFQQDAVNNNFIHIDFYQPALDEETEATVPLEFIGEAPAVKELGGTLVKNLKDLEVKALPQNLPHTIKVNVDKLKTFEDSFMIKDLVLPQGVKIERHLGDIIVLVTPPEKVEEELEKPIEEGVKEVEKVGEKEKEEKKAAEDEISAAQEDKKDENK